MSVSTEGTGRVSQPLHVPIGSCLLVSQRTPPARPPALPAEELGPFRLSTACAVLLRGMIRGVRESSFEGLRLGVVVVLWVFWGRWISGSRTCVRKQPHCPGCAAHRTSCSPSLQDLLIPHAPFLDSVNPENLAWIWTANSFTPGI